MLYREIIAVCSQIHTKHINTVCGQNVELLNVKLVVHIVTAGLQRVNFDTKQISDNGRVLKVTKLANVMGQRRSSEPVCPSHN